MSALVRAANRVKAFFRKPEHDADLDAEMAAHLDLAIDENTQQGMTPEEARRQALIRFGGVQLVDHAVSPRRFFVLLVVIFAGLGLLLASLGIYGVISYSVTQRTQEIGIRMALGATRAAVQLGVIGKTLGMAAGGIALGTLASLAVSRLVASLLFGTDPNDPYVFLIIVMILGAVGLLAGYLPARRASRIDPVVALRNH